MPPSATDSPAPPICSRDDCRPASFAPWNAPVRIGSGRTSVDGSVKRFQDDCAQAHFWLDAHGLRQSNSCAQTGFTANFMILLKSEMVIISPSFRNPTKTGAWNAPRTRSSTRLSTGCVDSSAHSMRWRLEMPESPRLSSLFASDCAQPHRQRRFRGECAQWLAWIALFHAQPIDSKSISCGHNFAIFPITHVFKGVERSPHKAMHSVIHSLCG